MRSLSDADIINIKLIANDIQKLAVKFDYHDSKVAELCYAVDTSMRTILDIIEGKNAE
jgi:hypothetical protein